MGMLITIDGPAGSGKSTVSRRIAEELGIPFLDTGALYRALAFFLHRKNIPPVEGAVLDAELAAVTVKLKTSAVLVNGEDVTQFIRSPGSMRSSRLMRPAVLRRKLLDLQRDQAGELVSSPTEETGNGGLSLGDAEDLSHRLPGGAALRRWKELRNEGSPVPLRRSSRRSAVGPDRFGAGGGAAASGARCGYPGYGRSFH
jgi:cytidylate kinase